jgi:hypothetical protein
MVIITAASGNVVLWDRGDDLLAKKKRELGV